MTLGLRKLVHISNMVQNKFVNMSRGDATEVCGGMTPPQIGNHEFTEQT